MAVTSDLGDTRDVHPRNKRHGGHPLALAKTYEYSDIGLMSPGSRVPRFYYTQSDMQ